MKKISFVTVNYNNDKGLLKTLDALIRLKSLKPLNIEIILIDGLSGPKDKEIIDKFKEFIDIIIIEKDKGIYDAMNKGIKAATGNYINFMNSGDIPIIDGMIKFITRITDHDSIYYGKGIWSKKLSSLFKDSISCFWLKMPNHQAMFIPAYYHKENLYNLSYPIAADLDFKLKAFKDLGVNYHDIDIVLSEPGGASQTIKSLDELLTRAIEIKKIASKNNGIFSGYLNFTKFILWHSRRLFS